MTVRARSPDTGNVSCDGHVTCMSSAMMGKLAPISSVPNTTFRTWPESVRDSERVRTGCRAGLLVISQDREDV